VPLDARKAKQAEETYLAALRRALSCLTPTVLLTRPAAPDATDRIAELAENPARLRSRHDLTFSFTQTYRLAGTEDAGGWIARPTGYRYELAEADGHELVAYHWHPASRSPVVVPHLHATIRGATTDFGKPHLPTAVVTPQAVIRCLITEFGVEPLRRDWARVLRDA
jgi:hypothetical protein